MAKPVCAAERALKTSRQWRKNYLILNIHDGMACCAGGEPAVSPAGRVRGGSCPTPNNPCAPDRREFPLEKATARRRKTRCALPSRSSNRLRLKTSPSHFQAARLHGQFVLISEGYINQTKNKIHCQSNTMACICSNRWAYGLPCSSAERGTIGKGFRRALFC
jgi:hypothetical protein